MESKCSNLFSFKLDRAEGRIKIHLQTNFSIKVTLGKFKLWPLSKQVHFSSKKYTLKLYIYNYICVCMYIYKTNKWSLPSTEFLGGNKLSSQGSMLGMPRAPEHQEKVISEQWASSSKNSQPFRDHHPASHKALGASLWRHPGGAGFTQANLHQRLNTNLNQRGEGKKNLYFLSNCTIDSPP